MDINGDILANMMLLHITAEIQAIHPMRRHLLLFCLFSSVRPNMSFFVVRF